MHSKFVPTSSSMHACKHHAWLYLNDYSARGLMSGENGMPYVFVCVFCVSTFSPPNTTISPLTLWKGESQVTFCKVHKEPNLCECRIDVTQYSLEGLQHKGGRRLQIKHSNQLRWEVDPWQGGGLGSRGMSLKLCSWKLCLLTIAKLWAEPKPLALTWTRSFPHSNFRALHKMTFSTKWKTCLV